MGKDSQSTLALYLSTDIDYKWAMCCFIGWNGTQSMFKRYDILL